MHYLHFAEGHLIFGLGLVIAYEFVLRRILVVPAWNFGVKLYRKLRGEAQADYGKFKSKLP